jgi:hypothetical protein
MWADYDGKEVNSISWGKESSGNFILDTKQFRNPGVASLISLAREVMWFLIK